MEVEEEEDCQICSDPLTSRAWVVLYNCKHAMHFDCLQKWFFNCCMTVYDLRKDNAVDHPNVDLRPISLMQCLRVAPKCPQCRTLWVPDPTSPEPPNQGPNQSSNHLLNIEVTRLVQIKSQEMDVGSSVGQGAIVTSVHTDEHRENCVLCGQRLYIRPWARLKPCLHLFHVVCAAGYIADTFMGVDERSEPIILCPALGCGTEVEFLHPYEWVSEGYNVRPVVPADLLKCRPIHRARFGSGMETKSECIWALMYEGFTSRRDDQFEAIMEHARGDVLDEAALREQAADERRHGSAMMEFQRICYICRLLLACTGWVEIECGHGFHYTCIYDMMLDDSDIYGDSRACPVCRLAIRCSHRRMPRGLWWANLDAEYSSSVSDMIFPFVRDFDITIQLEEALLWWALDLRYYTQAQAAALAAADEDDSDFSW